jgi:hypothetical protein
VDVNTIVDELLVRVVVPRLKAAGSALGIVEYQINKIIDYFGTTPESSPRVGYNEYYRALAFLRGSSLPCRVLGKTPNSSYPASRRFATTH